MGKEYRIMVYFAGDAPQSYTPRSYQRRIYQTLQDAVNDYPMAVERYRDYRYLSHIAIESREVTDWYTEWKEKR